MNRSKNDNEQQAYSKIETALATEEQLIPSSGFLASVMDRVHDESRMPAPIPFPWKRAIPGILLTLVVFGWSAFQFVRQAVLAIRAFTFTLPQFNMSASRPVDAAAWVALAFVVSLASWMLARRLSGLSGLL